MKSKQAILWLAVLFVFTGGVCVWAGFSMMQKNSLDAWERSQQTRSVKFPVETSADTHDISAPAEAGERKPIDFKLSDQQGEDFSSEELKGKVWIGSFFFVSCPSICRMQNMRVAELQRDYKGQGVHFVSITCDPDRDTTQKLLEYSRIFNADPKVWHFLRGDFDYVKGVANEQFQLTLEKETHSDRLALFDGEGNMVGTYRATVPRQMADLREKLDELLEK